jgi:hypothetical protein
MWIWVFTSISFSLDPCSSIFSVLRWIKFFFYNNLFSFSWSSFFSFSLVFSFLFFSFLSSLLCLLSLCLSLFQFALGNPFVSHFIKEFFLAVSGVSRLHLSFLCVLFLKFFSFVCHRSIN